MTKRSIIRCILSLAMAVYLVFALRYTSHAAATDNIKGLDIKVQQTGVHGFVNAEDIDMMLDTLSRSIKGIRRCDLNTKAIESKLMEMDKIEGANCVVLYDGSLYIEANPLVPVARVFDGDINYYINRSGKRMTGGPQFRVDMPVVVGKFGTMLPTTYVIPVLDYINKDSQMSKFITAIEVKDKHNIMLIPAVSGQIVNFGDTSDIDNKFDRLKIFYRDVISVKGWATYDTISVKWRNQVVANRRNPRKPQTIVKKEDFLDIDTITTIVVSESQLINSTNY